MAAEAHPSTLLPQEEEEEEEEEYIDMDVSSSTFMYYTFVTSPSLSDDFEFHLSSKDPTAIASPADELFYKGKLLPLHLPPRLQMLDSILQGNLDTNKSLPISPFSSCRVSGELASGELAQPVVKRRWPGKLRFIRKCSSGLKIIVSRSFTIKSLFFKPSRSRSGDFKGEENCERRSISGAICRYLPAVKHSRCSSSCSSSSCSPSSSSTSGGSSNGRLCASPVMRRSSSVDSEEGSSIQRAIAYCKSSHQQQE